MKHRLHLRVLDDTLAICQLPPGTSSPAWARGGELLAEIRAQHELTIVCRERLVPVQVTAERGWRAIMVQGPLAFSLTGVLAALAEPLARADISIFALSTYDTDYVLVKCESLELALHTLQRAGHTILDQFNKAPDID